jgi:hypothetical protein
MCYNTCMEKHYVTMRLHAATLHKLRLIAALSNERMIATVERLATQELARLQAEQGKQKESHV